MKIFEVTRWGNDTGDGFNSADTNYLVLASHAEEAAGLVCTRERNADLGRYEILELGVCQAEVQAPVIFRGPYLEHKFMRGAHFTSWAWNARLETWVATPSCTEGEATAQYANGQLAARVCFRKGEKRILQHGVFEHWHANGQLMERAEYQWGRPVGRRESWYADGTLAGRDEWSPGGMRSQRWDRGGRPVSDVFEESGKTARQHGEPGREAPAPALDTQGA